MRCPASLARVGCALLLAACAPAPERPSPPLLLVGVDGAERRVLETMWSEGELPTLRGVAARGAINDLATDFGISPVIWTTIATGVDPTDHGVTDFVVASDRGDVPVSSTTRRRAALWNMLSAARRRVAMLGWWATWPAESVRGLLVSDRAGLGLGEELWPAERAAELERWVHEARRAGPRFGGNPASELHDRVVTLAARTALGEKMDLVAVYYRSVDLASHDFWHRFAPGDFARGAPPGAANSPDADPVRSAYRAVDAALATLLAAAPKTTSVMVLSDHGFRAETVASLQLLLDFDRLLVQLGWQVRAPDGGVDTTRSRAWCVDSPDYHRVKRIRFAPSEDRALASRALAKDLARVSFAGGRAAFALRSADRHEQRRGLDLIVTVDSNAASPELSIDGRIVDGVVTHFGRITGGHARDTAGILLTAGPLFAPGARAEVSIRDITPTVLHLLGLPVADDFSGRAALELMAPAERNRALRRIASWGVRASTAPRTSPEDRRLLDELGALGYLK